MQGLAVFVIFGFSEAFASTVANCTPPRSIFDRLGLLNVTVYDKMVAPSSRPEIRVGALVQSIIGINDTSQYFVAELMFSEMWKDRRLAFKHLNPCSRNISLAPHMYDQLWTPQLTFTNSKRAIVHESPFKNLIVVIFQDGRVFTQYRVTLTCPCVTYLYSFPMDTQSCYLRLESYLYSHHEIRTRWVGRRPILIRQNTRLPKDFYISNVSAYSLKKNHSAGVWDELMVKITFVRRYGWYMLNVYIPTYLVVFVSWVSFFLGPRAIPARTMIGVNALVALTVQFGMILKDLPRVSYTKAIDIWMFTGMLFVFGSLLELAIVGWLSRNDERPSLTQYANDNEGQRSPEEVERKTSRKKSVAQVIASAAGAVTGKAEADNWSRGETIDQASAFLFPFVFVVFNAYYWIYFLLIAKA